MIKRLLLIIGIGIGSVFFQVAPGVAADSGSDFTEANKYYAAGNFKKAAETYERIVRSGNASGAVYYNLGNAYLKNGQKGEAVLAYRRAQRMIPRDEDVRWNLNVVRAALQDRAEQSEDNILIYGTKRVIHRVTMNEVALLVALSLGLWFLLSLIVFFVEGAKVWTGLLRGLAVIVFFAAAVLMTLKFLDTKEPRVIILDPEVTAYYGPSDKESKAFVLHEGAEVRLVDRMTDWYYIRFGGKNNGWISKNSCEII